MQTTIEVDGELVVTGPFSPDNNEAWRGCGGKFSNGSWRMPDTPANREAIARRFGAKSPLVDVLVEAAKLRDGSVVQIGGYVLASRRGRDYAVRMPDGVSLESGSFSASGGSVKSPRVCAGSDVVFRLRCRQDFATRVGLPLAPPAGGGPDV